MNMHSSSNSFHQITVNSQGRTAINTGIQAIGHNVLKTKNQFVGNLLSFSLNKAGTELEMERLFVEQFMSYENKIFIVLSAHIQGYTLLDYLKSSGFENEKREAMHILALLINSHSDLLPARINPDHILHSGGSLLIIPGKWSQIITSHEAEESLRRGFEPINYPDEKGAEKQVRLQIYAFATSLYYMFTGKWPVDEVDTQIQHRFKRTMVYRPIEVLLPTIADDLAQWFYQALRMETADVLVPLKHLPHIAVSGSADGQDGSDELGAASISGSKRISSWKLALKRESIRLKIKKKAALIVALSLSAAAVLFLGIAVTRQLTRDLAVTGLSAELVVQRFYESYNTLDHEFMSEATHRSAGRRIISQISSIYAVSTIREGTERREVFISAADWFSDSETERGGISDYLVFGITDLSIVALSGFEDDVQRFTVQYTLWSPAENALVNEQVSEYLALQKFRRGWKIIEFGHNTP